jgi:GT2 family glycosyltransferase
LIDIIVPIYNAPAALARCLAALAQDPPAQARVLLIDDASPDPAVQPLIDAFAPALKLRNPHNLGFVGTVNRGLKLGSHDVVLLNSDTVPAPGWLDELRACAASDPTIGTVTPWSNHAEICSFPEWLKPNPEPADLRTLAVRLKQHAPRAWPRLPTAVGFCMLIKRALIERIGDFDHATFGRGYGEENDFCVRASAHGYCHALCDSAYVVHQGGASFGPIGLKPNGANYARLLARYPHYERLIAEFIAADPYAGLRAELGAQVEDLLTARAG